MPDLQEPPTANEERQALLDHGEPVESDAEQVPEEDLPPLYDENAKGGVWTAASHIITAVIGAGVLSLSWSVAQLGWVAGPLAMLCFAFVSVHSSFYLATCYCYPDAYDGPHRNRSYKRAVRYYLGRRHALFCATMQYASFYVTAIAYTITTAECIRAILISYCYHKKGHEGKCDFSESTIMAIFGTLQILCSQLRDFNKISWLSFLAAIMSFSYASIGLFLGISKVVENGTVLGSIGGIIPDDSVSTFSKIFRIFQAVGDVAFAFPFTALVIEIQNTLKRPPAQAVTLKKASMTSASIITTFYLLCGCFGYAAFGKDAPGNLLTGFGSYEPYWVVGIANFCVAVHLVGAYQVYCQPFFAFGENWARRKWPRNSFVNKKWRVPIKVLFPHRINLMRVCWRTVFVISTTVFAILFPSFNNVLAILGALNFWPLTVYLPVKMHMARKGYLNCSTKGIILNSLSIICLLISIAAAAGSIEGFINGA
eukprot:TRINITY_DN2963_c0_g1_i1.p1 TRINITY_DN2963_c0_g1~~TRINITY_DN2963_c0_g1_i1.p1  ORF type:complete len:483 (-),score=23.65 TRINITY_DN2963_c0_g1_i1:948-2396(-)